MESVLDNITDCFFSLDRHWRFTYVNREFETLVHRNRDAVMGNTIWELFPDLSNLKFSDKAHQSAEENKKLQFEEYIACFNKWFNISVYPNGNGLDIYLRDITEEKIQQQQIQVQSERLREIAWIQSHKVRGPVATILGLIDLFNADNTADPVNSEIVKHLRLAAHDLDGVIKEIVTKAYVLAE